MLRETEPSGFSQVSSSSFWLVLYYLIVPQPLSRQEILENFVADLVEARDFIESEAPQSSLQWLINMHEQFRPGFKCVKDNKRHANRRTLPKTNETDRRGQPLPRNVIGYMSFDK